MYRVENVDDLADFFWGAASKCLCEIKTQRALWSKQTWLVSVGVARLEKLPGFPFEPFDNISFCLESTVAFEKNRHFS